MRPTFSILMASGLVIGSFMQPALADKASDTLVWSTDREVAVVDPYYNNTRELVIMGHLGWDTLLFRNLDTGEYEPLLATGMGVGDDNDARGRRCARALNSTTAPDSARGRGLHGQPRRATRITAC